MAKAKETEVELIEDFQELAKVSDNFSVNRYSNGWMMEVSGKDSNDDWKTVKVLCNTQEELFAYIAAYNTVKID